MRGTEGKDKLRSVPCFRLEQLMGRGRIYWGREYGRKSPLGGGRFDVSMGHTNIEAQ